jgi:hypothetical protein
MLGLGRRQRQDIDTCITQASKLSVARRNRIVKLAGPAFLVATGPAQGAHQISKKVPPANLPLTAKSLGTGMQARAMLVGLGERQKVQSASGRAEFFRNVR